MPVFEFIEQKKIAEILSKVDTAIEQTQNLIAKYQRIKTGLMQDLLTKGIDENGNVRSEETHEFKDSVLGRIPKEWDSVYLRRLILDKPKNGYSPKEVNGHTGLRAIGLGCLTTDGFKPIQLKNISKDNALWQKALLKDGDFLISRANTKELVGLVGIYRDISTQCIYPDLMMKLCFKEDINDEYMEYFLSSPFARNQIKAKAVGTSESMVKISQQIVSEIWVSSPKLEEQNQITEVLNIEKNNILKYINQLDKLQKVKTGLMQDLLSGKKRVTKLITANAL